MSRFATVLQVLFSFLLLYVTTHNYVVSQQILH